VPKSLINICETKLYLSDTYSQKYEFFNQIFQPNIVLALHLVTRHTNAAKLGYNEHGYNEFIATAFLASTL
jgi:hypothetical protein